jgi:protein disulfide-isomerase-like protein
MANKVKKNCRALKYMKEHWGEILLFVIIIVLLIIGIIYSQKNCNKRNNNFEFFDTNSNEPCITLFYAPWCGHCKRIIPEWEKLSNSNVQTSSGKKVKVIKVNCDENKDLATKHNVPGFPTIKYFPNGMNKHLNVHNYSGERTTRDLIDFVKKF